MDANVVNRFVLFLEVTLMDRKNKIRTQMDMVVLT